MNLKVKRLGFAGLALLLLASLSVESTITRATLPQRRSPARSRSALQVAELFRANCARCHGADGRGDTLLGHTYNAPDFTNPEWWQKHSDITSTRSLRSIVTRGRGRMPAFGKKLTRAEINLLVIYIRRFRNHPSASSH